MGNFRGNARGSCSRKLHHRQKYIQKRRDRSPIIVTELACPPLLLAEREPRRLEGNEILRLVSVSAATRRIRPASRSGLGRHGGQRLGGDRRRCRKWEEGSTTGRRIGKEGTTSRFEHPVYTSRDEEPGNTLFVSVPPRLYLLLSLSFTPFVSLPSLQLPLFSSLAPQACSLSIAWSRSILVPPLIQASFSLVLCKVKRSSGLGRWPQLAVTQCER